MMASVRLISSTENLSVAWAEAFLKVMENGVTELSPHIITVTDIHEGSVCEDLRIRGKLDKELARHGKWTCHTVANTIFPESLWNAELENGASLLYDRYAKIWPRIQGHRGNRRGVYFQRLIAYQPQGSEHHPINQLQHVIDTYKRGNHRRSALQASVFDPTRDHKHSRQLGFPCLQQISFTPTDNGGLHLTAFYPIQYLLERAYGNYLGLCRLGRFMATQMALPFEKMTCIAIVAKRSGDGISKTALHRFANLLRNL